MYNCGYHLVRCSCSRACQYFGDCCHDYEREFLLIKFTNLSWDIVFHVIKLILLNWRRLVMFHPLHFYPFCLNRHLLENNNTNNNNVNSHCRYSRCCCHNFMNLSDPDDFKKQLFQLCSSIKNVYTKKFNNVYITHTLMVALIIMTTNYHLIAQQFTSAVPSQTYIYTFYNRCILLRE